MFNGLMCESGRCTPYLNKERFRLLFQANTILLKAKLNQLSRSNEMSMPDKNRYGFRWQIFFKDIGSTRKTIREVRMTRSLNNTFKIKNRTTWLSNERVNILEIHVIMEKAFKSSSSQGLFRDFLTDFDFVWRF